MWVAGADGCRGGWIVVLRSLSDAEPRSLMVERLADVFAMDEQPALVAVDIPIGLPEVSQRGGRMADRMARQVLAGARQSSVFAAPCRAALVAHSFAQACEIELRHSDPPKKVSQQIFHLLDKIREADRVARDHAGRVFECHPEVTFAVMNGGAAMRLPKRVSRRKNPAGVDLNGLDERRALLSRNGYPPHVLQHRPEPVGRCGFDDLLDACAAAWTAGRIAQEGAIRLPPEPDVDGTGLDMAIWA